tara:strand:+ start:204 stop:623 length:420 start_codon:yes stop_codon:yes gene_type:complete
MEDCSPDQKGPSLKSKKFLAYLFTLPMLSILLLAQVYVDYQLALVGKEPLFSEEFMTLQFYIIGLLSTVYVGGQAALDAVLGWVRGSSGKTSQPQVVVVGPQTPDRSSSDGWEGRKQKMRPRTADELKATDPVEAPTEP